MRKLVNGLIPAFTDCPYRKECGTYGKEFCFQTGIKHKTSYSCGMARAFDISENHKPKTK